MSLKITKKLNQSMDAKNFAASQTPKHPIEAEQKQDPKPSPAKGVVTEIEVNVAPGIKVILHQPKIETAALTEEEALTSEYIGLWRRLEEAGGAELLKRMEVIKKNLQSVANDTMDATKPAVFKCLEGELEYSARGSVLEVKDIKTLLTELETKFDENAVLSVIKIGMTELKKLLSEHELFNYVDTKPGSRILKSVRPVKE